MAYSKNSPVLKRLRIFFNPLSRTPIHPQWMVTRYGRLPQIIREIGKNKKVLDIGCFNKWPRKFLSEGCSYIGLDYPAPATAINWYQGVPDIFGDAANLPFAATSFDAVLLLDVLEHISEQEKTLTEIHRVLAPSGCLIIRMPFLYPLHDEPHDFYRLTRHGFAALSEKQNYAVESIRALGQPVETAALLINLALSKMALNWISTRNPAVVLIPLFLFLILLNNLAAAILCLMGRDDDSFMPFSYEVVLRKN